MTELSALGLFGALGVLLWGLLGFRGLAFLRL